MDIKEFKSNYESWGTLDLWKYLPDLWRERFIDKAELGSRTKKKMIFYDGMHIEIGKSSSKKDRLTLTFKLQFPRKIPEIDAVIEFDKDEESTGQGLHGDPALMDIVNSNKNLSNQVLNIYQSELLPSFRFEIKDIDLLHDKYAMVMHQGDIKTVPEEKRKEYFSANFDFLFDKWLGSQLCDMKAYVSVVESIDGWLKLLQEGKEPSQEFIRILNFIEGIKAEFTHKGFEPPVGHRKFMHLESELGFAIRSEARQRLLGSMKHFLSQKDPLSKETATAIHGFYETIQNLFYDWEKRFSWKKFSGNDWTHTRFTSSMFNRRGLVKETYIDKVEEPPWKDIAKRAQKGKSLSELQVAQFLSTILEWLGPGEDLGNVDFNVTLEQVRNQLENRAAIPHTGPTCAVCGTPNQENFTECYWCHGPL